jgi:anti-sigma regulatory factor (Ser/Thr protein kinase)
MGADVQPGVLECVALPGVPESVREARRWLRKLLDTHPRADTAELLLSEVLTNAIVHTESTVISVTLLVSDGGAIRTEVIDQGAATLPCVCRHGDAEPAESGRGIFIVRSQADRWGFTEEEFGCLVWFGLDATAA